MDRPRTLAAVGAALCLVVAGPAPAHQVQYPKTDVLAVTPHSLTLHTEYVVPTKEESGLLFRLFDRDHSGALNDSERHTLRDYLCQQAGAFVVIELDGHPLPLQRTQAELVPPGRTDLVGASLTLTAPVVLTAGPHTLRLFDRHKDRMLAVPVRVTLDGLRLTSPLPPLPLLTANQPIELHLVPAAPPR